MNRTAPPACRVQPPARRSPDGRQAKSQGASRAPGSDRRGAASQTDFFSDGEALKRTVLPAFTLIDSPVRGLSPLRALVLRTVKVPKLGRVNLPAFFSSLTIASMRSPA